jgi:ribosomal protein L11 methyltransferase
MYRALTILVPEELSDDASALLFEHGADGVQVEDSTIRLMPDRPPLPKGQARLVAYFSPEALDAALEPALGDLAGSPVQLQQEALPDRDWNEVWKSHFAPIEISPRLWVCPSWRLGETPASARVLVLDPGMAFGTGTHATTSLCMHEIDAWLSTHPNASVLDVGTGSGILAIAAKLLGAARVVGTDIDPVATRVAVENAALNKVELELKTGGLAGSEQFQLVVANIMADALISMSAELIQRVAPGGRLLLSGILDFQASDVAAAFVSGGLPPPETATQGEWVLLRFSRSTS